MPSYAAIRRELTRLGDEETLLVQSGKPVAVFETHERAPRVLIANTNLVPEWATWEHFRELDAAGLIMYGQMTAGSWIYIGSQGILQGTYETFAAAARKRFDGHLAGPLGRDRRAWRDGRRAAPGHHDVRRNRALHRGRPAPDRAADRRPATWTSGRPISTTRWRGWDGANEGQALSIGLLGNAAEILPELVRRDVHIDVVTDQTSAHDPLNGYVPAGLTVEQAERAAAERPRRVPAAGRRERARARRRDPRARRSRRRGVRLRQCAAWLGGRAWRQEAFAYPGFVPAYIRPLFCEGKGPFRWVALSGDPEDIHRTDAAILELFGDQEHIARWIRLAAEQVHFQGLPARICWLGYGERHLAGERFNEMVASGN